MKIAFIGAGSIVFARNVLTDVLAFEKLRKDTTICLEDIDEGRLKRITDYFERYRGDNIDKLESVTFESTTNQRDAIRDARYIICAFQVGGLDAYQLDMDIPKKYGIHQVVGDTLGPGGIFRFLRSAKAYTSIMKDIEEVGEHGVKGSKPLFMNYSNPMAMNTWYCNSLLPNSTIGLCHGVQGTARLLKMYAGAVMPGEFTFFCAGINHMAWFLELWYRDPFEDPDKTGPWKDAYPIINEHLADEPEMRDNERVRLDMYEATGYFMTESSGHLAEYLPYYLKREDLIEKFRAPHGRGFESLRQSHYLKSGLEKADAYGENMKEMLAGDNLRFKNKASDEYCASIINAIETGKPFRFNGNLINTNQGLITNLPDGCCVEVPIFADEHGLHPQGGIRLPPVCQGLCMSNIMVQQAAVKGMLEKDRELVYHACLLDPNTAAVCSPQEIREMMNEMIDAEEKWMPEFLR